MVPKFQPSIHRSAKQQYLNDILQKPTNSLTETKLIELILFGTGNYYEDKKLFETVTKYIKNQKGLCKCI